MGIDGKMYIRDSHSSDIYRLNIDSVSATLACSFPSYPDIRSNVGDIAYNPIDNKFYGTRDSSNILLKYNFSTCSVDSVTLNKFLPSANGAFYVSADGTGYGYQNGSGTLLRFNLSNGSVDSVGQSLPTLQTDGCSCEGIKFFKDVNVDTSYQGGTVTYTFIIYNNWFNALSNVSFKDTLRDGFTWSSQPYALTGATISGSITTGQNIGDFTITNLPLGVSSFKINATVPTIYTGPEPNLNQAYLKNLPGILVPFKISDYPKTPAIDDPTPVHICRNVSLVGPNSICIGQTTALSPSSGGTWTSNNPAIATVTATGLVTGISSGVANFTFHDTDKNCTVSSNFNVTVKSKPSATLAGPSAICVGDTTILLPSSGGIWSSSNTSVASITNAGKVSGLSSGLAVFTFTSSITGCSSDASSSVTINANPSVNIDFSGSECLTNNLQLTAVPSGGLPSYNYNWSGPSSFSATSAVINISTNGNYTVTITDSKGCKATDNAIIYQSFVPLIVNLTTDICEGESVVLNATGAQAVAYHWSSNAGSATSSQVTVFPAFPSSTYTVTVTNNVGCTASVNTTISVRPKPSVVFTGSTPICVGSTTNLSPTSGGVWTSSNNLIATVTNLGKVTGIAPGNVTFTLSIKYYTVYFKSNDSVDSKSTTGY